MSRLGRPYKRARFPRSHNQQHPRRARASPGKKRRREDICKVCFFSTLTRMSVSAEMIKFSELDDEVSSSHSDGVTLSDSDPKDCGGSDPKDSGVECGSDPQSDDVPDEETADQIMKTVEFYLSDANVLKDPFLLKHVRRNKEGYVSLKLLASFRKVRSLSRSWKAVALSVQRSKLLALNADGSKVRRLTPLPDYDETVTSRCVIVSGLDKPLTVDGVSEMFSQCGEIALVRILRPGGSIPSDVKRFLNRNPELAAQVCALVEFEEHAAVLKALETTGASVAPIAIKEPGSPRKEPPQESPKKKKKNRKGSLEKKELEGGDKRTRRSSSGSVSSQSSGYLSSSPNSSSSFDSRYPRRHSFNPSIYNDPNSSFASLSQRGRLNSASTLSPWRRRREQLLVQSDSNLSAVRPAHPSSLVAPVRTVRMPKGPDGTNGFCTRARLPSTAE